VGKEISGLLFISIQYLFISNLAASGILPKAMTVAKGVKPEAYHLLVKLNVFLYWTMSRVK